MTGQQPPLGGVLRQGELSRRRSWVYLQPRCGEVEEQECRRHNGKEHPEYYGLPLRLACSLWLEWISRFEKNIQRAVHHSKILALFHSGFERSEHLAGGHPDIP